MNILGLQKLTLLDYPGHLAAIIFLGGCNFRCPFCQNSSLVLAPHTLPKISMEEFHAFLKKRSGILEGICVTGGEPTLHPDLPQLFQTIHDAGYLAKLDTNGTNPDLLRQLIEDGLVDYVAMDIKAGRENYHRVCGIQNHFSVSDTASDLDADHQHDSCPISVDCFPAVQKKAEEADPLTRVKQSAEILLSSSIEYEFRTTAVQGLHTETDFLDIARWISGCRHYYLQSFRDCEEVLQTSHSFSAFSEAEMLHFLELVQKEIPQAGLRGI